MSLQELQDEIATALEPIADEVPDLQVHSGWNDNPAPPTIDVYPGTPFMDGAGFGVANVRTNWTVRARVGMADSESAQRLLLRLLDPTDPASVEAAIQDVAVVAPEGVSGFDLSPEDSGVNDRMLSATWHVRAFL